MPKRQSAGTLPNVSIKQIRKKGQNRLRQSNLPPEERNKIIAMIAQGKLKFEINRRSGRHTAVRTVLNSSEMKMINERESSFVAQHLHKASLAVVETMSEDGEFALRVMERFGALPAQETQLREIRADGTGSAEQKDADLLSPEMKKLRPEFQRWVKNAYESIAYGLDAFGLDPPEPIKQPVLVRDPNRIEVAPEGEIPPTNSSLNSENPDGLAKTRPI